MSSQNLSVLIVICVWLLMLFISGMLAIRYKFKHKKHKQVYKPFIDELEALKKQDLDIKPISISYDLPKNEDCLYQILDTNIYLSQQNKRIYKTINKDTSDDDIDYWFDDIKMHKKDFTLSSKNYKKPTYTGALYLTNIRLMIETSSNYIQVPLSACKKAWATCFLQFGEYVTGFYLLTDGGLYMVECKEPKIVLILNNLLKQLKEKG